jgi:DNA-binding winged helix-turn-helix (wHTH) protein/class 3 adenylate cyclase/tetratricopeptide (TPR) repeat protein
VTDPAVRDRRTSARYVFADCLLDTQLYTLYRAGLPVPLRPKAFHVLRYLLEHCDHLVTKDELCAHVWPAQFISDATIESCIKHVRQAIGDTGRTQELIQTRRGYGYRFVGMVEERPEAPVAQEATVTLPFAPDAPAQNDADRRPEPTRPRGKESEAACAGAASPVLRASLAPGAAPASSVWGAPQGERKLVTLLGCTPAHAAALGARVGLDALHSQMRTLYTLAQQEVHRYGGTIHSIAGTRLLAIFGAPLAQEDHAWRALLAALGLQQQLAARSGDPAEEQLTACVGLHSGAVVMGGIGEAQGAAIVGDLTLTVEALQERGAPGMLLCSEATARLVRRHDVRIEEIAPVPVPRRPRAVRAYRVMGLRSQDVSAAQLALPALGPFVGRTHELATLHAMVARALRGRGQTVGIVGEPGIGKSRLLMEFRQQLHAHGRVAYLEGHCLSYGSATPYRPVLELLRAHCGITPADGDDVITAKVSGSIEALGLEPKRAAPYLLHLLGVEAASVQVAGSSPDALKAHTFAALRQLWLKSSQQNPLILAVEDLHWSDPTSEEFVASLVDGLPGAALLVLATYRPGYRPPWVEKSYTTQLTVPPLSAQDSMRVVHAVLEFDTAPPPLAEALLAKAQGNPFFLEELARTLMDQAVWQDEPTSRSAPCQSSTDFRLPATVEAVLAGRIDRLSADAKQLLQTAAIIGIDVPLPLLQLVAELPEVALHESLAHLQAAEFLYEIHRSPEHAYTFKHALTQEVAYRSLLLDGQRLLHARIVAAIETLTTERAAEAGRWPGSDQVERLAHHAVRGQVWAKALVYCRQAEEHAMARSAHREAASCFEQAILALPHLSEVRATREQAIDLRLALRSALHPCGELGRAMACVREAETLAVALEDPRRLGQVSVSLSLHCYLVGAYDHAIAAAQRALALADAAREVGPHVLVLANLHLGFAYQAQGEYRRAIDCLSRTVAPLDEVQGHTRFGELVPAVFTPAYLAACHAELGTFAEGRSVGDAGLGVAKALDHPMSLAFASWGIGLLALRQGDLSRSVSVLEGAVNLRQDGDRPAWFPLMAAALGAAYTLAGCIDDARRLLTQALEQTIAMEVVVNQALCSISLGEAQLLAGCLEEAHSLAEGALSLARAHQERGNEAYALHLLGEIALRRRPPKRALAEAYYRQALARAEALGMHPLMAHCHRALGTLYAKTGRRKRARSELSTAIQKYRTMEMTFWLPRAEAVLAQVV